MNHEEEIPEEKFTPTDCPVCGGKEAKIVDHLKNHHQDLEMEVTRVSETALRCQKCSISFAICDLVAHNIFCVESKQFQYIKERKVASANASTRHSKSGNQIEVPLTIPEGIGCSPVDVVEATDLTSPEVIKSAMECAVCGRTNKKFGTIAECLRSHGVYRCALCFNSYLDRVTYSAHIRSCHTLGSGRLQCPLCPKNQFVNAGQVAGHMYGTHWVGILRDGLGVLDTPPPKKSKAQVEEPAAAATAEPPPPAVDNAEVEDPNQSVGDGDGDGDDDESGDVSATTTEEDSLSMDIEEGKEDYSSITLGSLLKTSEKPSDKEEVSADDIIDINGGGMESKIAKISAQEAADASVTVTIDEAT
jgi:hypothetical protein